jgi:uncharacterized lipoprotein YajG
MKKFLVVLVVLAMVSGCTSFGVFSPKAQAVVDFICSPTQAQMDEAAKWLGALDNIQAGVSIAFPPAGIAKASAVMTVLKNGGCFVLSEVEAALVLIGDMQAKQIKAKGPMMAAAAPSVQAQFPVLWATVYKGK